MITKIYSILDTVAQVYSQPFYMINDGMAIRAFSNEANDEKSNVCKYPEQFQLMLIGELNDKTAEIKSIQPKTIGLAVEFKHPDDNVYDRDDNISNLFDKLEEMIKLNNSTNSINTETLEMQQREMSELAEKIDYLVNTFETMTSP